MCFKILPLRTSLAEYFNIKTEQDDTPCIVVWLYVVQKMLPIIINAIKFAVEPRGPLRKNAVSCYAHMWGNAAGNIFWQGWGADKFFSGFGSWLFFQAAPAPDFFPKRLRLLFFFKRLRLLVVFQAAPAPWSQKHPAPAPQPYFLAYSTGTYLTSWPHRSMIQSWRSKGSS